MRPRKKTPPAEEASEPEGRYGLDVNAVVSYNLKAIRERQGWTQQEVADRLGQLTGHTLPQASISAMERRLRRRTPAPLRRPRALLAVGALRRARSSTSSSPRPAASEHSWPTPAAPSPSSTPPCSATSASSAPLDERLAEIGIKNPDEADQALVAVLGAKTATGAWHDHFRIWRKRRLREVERQYGDRLDEVADFLAEFAAQIKAVGPKTYLESMAHNERDAKRDSAESLDELPPDRRP